MSEPDTAPLGESPRPVYHFTAPRNWLNDPNGLVYVAGRYHLFYQHNPHDNSFGAAHWGHASSADLLTWEHHPIALRPDDLGSIFSGSAVIDHDDTAGFGHGAVVAAFTHHRDGSERQSLAFSTDAAKTWHKYPDNPVLTPPDGVGDFRDPRITRWEDADGCGHWVMLLAVGVAVWIYTSPDLTTWTRASIFAGEPDSARVWECPDLFQLPVEGTSERRWVLTVAVDNRRDGPPRGNSSNGTQYYVGDFDGATFTPAHDDVRRADHGADFYAAQSWNNTPAGRPLWIGWMNNWNYAGDAPTVGWRGALTVPRELGLRADGDRLRLTQRPIAELDRRRTPVLTRHDVELLPGSSDPLRSVRGTALDITMRIDVSRSHDSRIELAVRVGADEHTDIVADLATRTLALDRRAGGSHPLHRSTQPATAPLATDRHTLDVRVLVDTTSVEVFAAGGEIAITEQVFAASSSDGIRLTVQRAAAVVTELSVHAVEHRDIAAVTRNPRPRPDRVTQLCVPEDDATDDIGATKIRDA